MHPKPRSLLLKLERLPMRSLMTIGIGALCSSTARGQGVQRPDTVILMADTMGSTDTDSTPELHKLYIDKEMNFFAACAGRVEMGAEVVSIIHDKFAKLTKRTHGEIWNALNEAMHEHRIDHFRWDWGFRRNRSLFPSSCRSLVPRSCRSGSERSDASVCHLGEVIGIRQESFVGFSFLRLFCRLRVGLGWAGA